MSRFATTLTFLLLAIISFAQKGVFKGTPLENEPKFPELESQFGEWDLYQIDVQAFDGFVKKAGSSAEVQLKLGSQYDWDISLYPRDLRSPNFVLSILTDKGVEHPPVSQEVITFQGQLKGGSQSAVSLTIDEDLIYGFIKNGDEYYFIEPLWYFVPGQPKDKFVVYPASKVKPVEGGSTCGFDEMKHHMKDHGNGETVPGNPGTAEMTGMCIEIELAQASDLLMHNKFGSAGAVGAHIMGVMLNVQTNYDNEFNDELHFEIVEQFIVAPPGSDPWTNTTDAGELLDQFTSWGPSGFSTTHDLGQLWTNRNFDGSTIGIAWLSAVCTGFRYHCLQDFTSNANLLRVMTAHEIGHNFSASHDPSGSNTIMAPSVSNTNTWSSQSLNQINGYYPNRPCLTLCSTGLPPVAAFSASPTSGCAPLFVTYSDQSTNSPASWSWTFPGGVPATSNLPNPTVQYAFAGSYDATLTVTNGVGSSTFTQNNFITVESAPLASFAWSQVGLSVFFTNTSSANATSWFWQFGDGSVSTMQSPVHTYSVDGYYEVSLQVTGNCGTDIFVVTIPVFTSPIAGISASPTTGCAPLNVLFSSNGTPNATSWLWNFQGGTPAVSSQENPMVNYSAPGTYDVTLTVSNPAGSDVITLNDYIVVGTVAAPAFSYTVNGSTATFTNSTNNNNGVGAVTYLWNFGDGNTSTAANPVHTYAVGGNYTVTLTATNGCGPATATQAISILTPPVAGFMANVTSGCPALSVQFQNASSANATGFNWSFPGGSPASSTAANPTVVYANPGTYPVTLIATNPAGTDTLVQINYITVNPVAIPSFTSSLNGLTATFTNSSSNATSYAWDFGDGGTSTAANPVHTYLTDGTYTVTMTASNSCGDVSVTQSVTITSAPTAGFSANVTTGCNPLTVQFSNQSSNNATSFQWSFPGGTPGSSTDENPTVTYNVPGSYTVTLTVANPAGSNSTTQTDFIVVAATATAGFTYVANMAAVDFTNTSTNASSYAWTFGDGGTSALANPSHSYQQDGTYTVILSATNACGTVTTTQTISIVTPPTAGFSANATSGCAPLTIQFNNQSSENAATYNWSFPGGTPASSTEENPSVTYQSAGNYTVTLTVSNAAGTNTYTETNFITVNTTPDAGFNVSTNVFQANFTNNTTGGATSFAWAFGDGGTSSQESPSYTFPDEGTYTVTLTASNACGSSTYSSEVTITTLPQAGFSASATNGCVPFTVQFSNESSDNAESFEWSFPGGTPSTSTAENPSITYSTPGTYPVTLIASNAAGTNSSTQNNFITVGTVPDAGFTANIDELTVTFDNTSVNATSYVWDFGDGTAGTEEQPVHTYSQDGTYGVTLTATNDCGSVSTNGQFTVVTPPSAAFSAAITKGCTPFEVQFSNESSANAASFAWEFPGGTPATSTLENPVVTYNTAGVYSVKLTVANAAGNDVYQQPAYITVEAAPTAGFTQIVNNSTVTFVNLTIGADTYSWDFGDGTTSAEKNPEHTYATPDAYTVTLTATNDCGSVVVEHLVVVAGEAPVAAFGANETSGCAPLVVVFENLSSANAAQFEWSFPGGTPSTSTEENPEVKYDVPGVYDVTLVAGNGSGSDTFTETAYISVNTIPSVSFIYAANAGTLAFTNNSANATSYTWDFGDGKTSNEENPVHTYAAAGEYEVILTATNECGFVSSTQTVNIILNGLDEIPGVSGFQVFPNPNSGHFTMTLQGLPMDMLEISFTNVLGQRLMYEKVDFRSGSLSRQFGFDGLPAGVYIFQVKSGGHAMFRKVVVE